MSDTSSVSEHASVATKAGSTVEINCLTEAYILLDNQLRFVSLNASAVAIFQAEMSELLGRTPWEADPEYAGDPFETGLSNALADRTMVCFEQFRRSREQWFGVTAVPDGHGGLLVHLRDVSDRKAAELALEKALREYGDIFENSREGICRLDINGRALAVNPALARMLGYSSEAEAMTSVDSRNLAWMEPAAQLEFLALLKDRSFLENYECTLRRRDGSPVRVSMNVRRVADVRGDTFHYRCSVEDTTERRRIEQKVNSLATAIDQTEEQVIVTDPQGTILYCNPAFSKVTGYEMEHVVGNNPRILKSGKHPDDFYGGMWRTLQSGKVWKGRVTNRKRTGELYQDESTVSPIRDADGNVTGFVAVKRDVTEQLKLERSFLQAQKMETVGRLAGGLAHDFNNILQVINGYAALLLPRLRKEDRDWALGAGILKAGERAANLTRQLLVFSRKQTIEPRVLDLNTAIREARQMLERLIGENISIHTRLDSELDNVIADPEQLSQVLMNLVVNARDAMPEGGEVEISTCNDILLGEVAADGTTAAENAFQRSGLKTGRYARLSVRDNGTGMDEQTRLQIFEPFFTTKPREKGTGLGLSTVYGIIQQCKGWIDVASEPGEGTTFTIWLPGVHQATVHEGTTTVDHVAGHGGGETILIVEDQDQIRWLAKAMLEAEGFHILEAPTGDAALETALEHKGRIHLLFTDIVLPGISGTELSARMGLLIPNLKVLYMSGYPDHIAGNEDGRKKAAFISKPFTSEALAASVRETIAGQPR